MALERRTAARDTVVAFFASAFVAVRSVGKIDSGRVCIFVVGRVESRSGSVVVDDLGVFRDGPLIRVKRVIIHTVHTLVVVSLFTCIVSTVRSVAQATYTGVAVVLIRVADMICW